MGSESMTASLTDSKTITKSSGCIMPTTTNETLASTSSDSSCKVAKFTNTIASIMPNAYKYKRLLFYVYQDETYGPSHTAHDLVKSLIAAVNSSAALSTFDKIFIKMQESDSYLFYVRELLDWTHDNESLFASLESFVDFIRGPYLNMAVLTPILYFDTWQTKEVIFRLRLTGVMQKYNAFPKNDVLLFIIATHFYVLLIKEILPFEDRLDGSEPKSFINEVTKFLKSCAEFVLRSFNAHWRATLEGISYVSISKNVLVAKRKEPEMEQERSHENLVCFCTARCDVESVETETHKLLMFANSLRDDYIIEKNLKLQESMYFPIESAAVWMKVAVTLSNPSSEQMSCLVVLHRQNLKAGDSNGKAAFTLQPQADPVAFHFEKYSNPEVSFEVESSADGLQELICDLDKTSYMCARCLADREDEGKVTLMEVACIPNPMINLIRHGKFKFIEKPSII